MIRKGEEWGSAAGGPPDLVVTGDDADLAAALAGLTERRVRFLAAPRSDVARVVGLPPGRAPAGGRELPMDGLLLADGRLAVNAVVLGTPPDRLEPWHRRLHATVEVDGRAETAAVTGVVILTGQYLRGADLNPRSHPGDGILEVQLYAMAASQRRAMRARLRSGTHVPHPEILLRRGRRVSVRLRREWPLELDGMAAGQVAGLDVDVLAGAYRLLV